MSFVAKIFMVITVCGFLVSCATTPSSNFPDSPTRSPKTDKALIHAKLARGYLAQKQYAVAKTELDRALRINSNHSESNYVMALLMLELQQYDDAERYFKRAVRSNRANSEAAHDFGVYLCQISRERESIEYFEIAAANPLFERSYLSLMRAGECLARLNDPKAERFLKQALEIDPKLRPALYRLAELNYSNSEYLSARAYIERYFAAGKPSASSLLLAYQIEIKNGDAQMAEVYRTRLLEAFPGSKQAATVRGRGLDRR